MCERIEIKTNQIFENAMDTHFQKKKHGIKVVFISINVENFQNSDKKNMFG